MKPLNFSCVLIFSILIFTTCDAQSSSGLLLALSKKDHTLSVVDPVSFKVLGTAPVGEDPHEVIASTDGTKAYVSIYGGGKFHEINVIDVKTIKPITTIDTKTLNGPHGLAFVGGKLWFSAEGAMAVGRIDEQTNQVDWSTITGQDRTHMVYVSPDAKKIYTTNMGSGTVSIIEDKGDPKNWSQEIINVAKGCEGFDVLPDQSELWTPSAADGKMYVIDLKTKKLIKDFDANLKGANRLKFTPDGKLALVSSLQTGDLIVFDVKERKEIKRVIFGRACAGIEIEPSGERAFVAYTPDNYIAVVDLKTFELKGKIDVGGGPDGMAWVR